jgi:hypothetical protein
MERQGATYSGGPTWINCYLKVKVDPISRMSGTLWNTLFYVAMHSVSEKIDIF